MVRLLQTLPQQGAYFAARATDGNTISDRLVRHDEREPASSRVISSNHTALPPQQPGQHCWRRSKQPVCDMSKLAVDAPDSDSDAPTSWISLLGTNRRRPPHLHSFSRGDWWALGSQRGSPIPMPRQIDHSELACTGASRAISSADHSRCVTWAYCLHQEIRGLGSWSSGVVVEVRLLIQTQHQKVRTLISKARANRPRCQQNGIQGHGFLWSDDRASGVANFRRHRVTANVPVF